MNYFVVYALLALTTAIVAVYELIWPIKNTLDTDEKLDNFGALVVAFFCIAFLVAPVVFIPCIVPSVGERFREALKKELITKA